MSECPDIRDLVCAERYAGAASHVSECDACRDLAVLAAGRHVACELTDECAAIEPLIALLAVRALDTDDSARIHAHLVDCHRCLSIAAETILLVEDRAAVGAVEPPLELTVGRGRHWMRRAIPLMAAGAVAAAATVVLMLLLQSSGDDRRSGGTEREPANDTDREQEVYSVPDPEPEQIRLVVLVQGQERWMGNETHLVEDDPDRMQGAFVGVGPALDVLATMGPKGSRAAVMTYASKVQTRHPMTDIGELNASSIGLQADYRDEIGRALIAGLHDAHAMLVAERGRRILVVISDGEGQKEDIHPDLTQVRDRLRTDEVEVFTLQHHAVTTDSPVGQQNMELLGYSSSYTATSRDEFASIAKAIVTSVSGSDAVFARKVLGRVIGTERMGDDAGLITIDKGVRHGVTRGWRGTLLYGPDGLPVENGEFMILSATADESVARVEVDIDGVIALPYVRLWQ